MASKVKQVILDLTVEKDKKNKKGGKASKQSEEESHHLEEVENKKPGGNVRRKVRRLVPNFLWAIPNRHVDHSEGGEEVGRFVGQVMEAKRKSKEQQMRPYTRFRTPEPDNHYDFCLIP
ncbi:rCG20026 [Rattus norvegicus]|uniref:Protein BEX4 n=2 Tax=Rattus norvegicus TaxID=10116 RepID=BEX4_RAT|nr:protein BEX4 [Rattus norvegicus]Q3MKP9.1 RecName: Full=Protein BEX4; AltName: Full=Brain-expressed X-linked protein 4 [Rattus norvegicus]AAI28699.1 Brain expressed gene 4 [Rattus norvegicus]AAX40675.1 brain expressed X-linked 4 [Rattus norvegicus]EDL85812.1 rCG20026 [Rattus norvegicus]|eukprot:NP_001032643.1 protein BEX4 [Rattus norvegicus]